MVPRRAEVRFDCAGAAFSKVRASARVELFGNFWVPKIVLSKAFGNGLGYVSRSVRLLGPEGGSDQFSCWKVMETNGNQAHLRPSSDRVRGTDLFKRSGKY